MSRFLPPRGDYSVLSDEARRYGRERTWMAKALGRLPLRSTTKRSRPSGYICADAAIEMREEMPAHFIGKK